MISLSEYTELLPHRSDIEKFQVTKSMRNHEAMTITDRIRQRHGLGSINYGCDGCKIRALIDIWNMIKEYEENNK